MSLLESIFQDMVAALDSNHIVLPAFPEVALKARKVAESPEADAEMLARVVAKDPALASRILKVANSSLFGSSQTTGSLQTAISRLGLEPSKTLITNFALMQLMSPPKGALGREIKKLHIHSLKTAAWAYWISLHNKVLNPNRAMMAGMIHDIGYLPMLNMLKNQPEQFFHDQDVFDLLRPLHEKVGSMMLMYWNFSHDLINVVSEHDNTGIRPIQNDYRSLIALANLCAKEQWQHPDYDQLQYHFSPEMNLSDSGYQQEVKRLWVFLSQ